MKIKNNMFFLIALLLLWLMHTVTIFWFCQNTAGFSLNTWTKLLPLTLTVIYVLLFILAKKTDFWTLEEILLIYLGSLFLAFCIAFILICFGLILKLFHLTLPFNLGIPALCIWLAAVVLSLYTAAKAPTVKEISFETPVLTQDKKIAFIADAHFGATVSKKRAENLVKILNQQKPDLIVFAGDIFETNFKDSLPYGEIIAPVLPGKKFGVFGNHEYYQGLESERASFKRANINLLENRSEIFENINIIGINDIKTAKITKQEFENILREEVKPSYFNLLLTHTPLYFEEASKYGIDLMLSGHTHKGQIFPFNYLVRMALPYIYGHFKKDNSNLFVTSGTFFWGPPMRLLTNNEIVIITLKGMKK